MSTALIPHHILIGVRPVIWVYEGGNIYKDRDFKVHFSQKYHALTEKYVVLDLIKGKLKKNSNESTSVRVIALYLCNKKVNLNKKNLNKVGDIK